MKIDDAKPRLTFWKIVKDDTGNPMEVWLDNGKYIRWHQDVGFIGAGNDLSDSWLVKYIGKRRKTNGGIILIEDKFDEEERDQFLIHDLTERSIMAHGPPYDPAHVQATALEAIYTRNRWNVPAPDPDNGR